MRNWYEPVEQAKRTTASGWIVHRRVTVRAWNRPRCEYDVCVCDEFQQTGTCKALGPPSLLSNFDGWWDWALRYVARVKPTHPLPQLAEYLVEFMLPRKETANGTRLGAGESQPPGCPG